MYQFDTINLKNKSILAKMRKRAKLTCTKQIVSLVALFIVQIYSTAFAQLGIEMNKRLSNSSVKSIFQDSQGYMWFGTFDGLNRYDGYELRTYRNQLENENSIPHNYIYCITEDLDKKLWIGTGQGVGIYDRNFDTFSRLNYINNNNSKESYQLNADSKIIQIDRKNNVYIGTNGWGLLFKAQMDKAAIQIPFFDYRSKTNLFYYHVSALHIDTNDRIWLCIEGYGLYTFEKKSKQLQLVSKNVVEATSMISKNNNELLISNYRGIFVYNKQQKTFTPQFQRELKSTQINMISLESTNNLWIATQNEGVQRISLSQTEQNIDRQQQIRPYRLSSNTVYTLFIDRQNKKWIGTGKGGVHVINDDDYKFNSLQQKYYAAYNLHDRFIRSFAEYDDKIWIGTEGSGLYAWNPKTGFSELFTKQQQLPDNTVNAILPDKKGTLWIATDQGIMRYTKKDKFKKYTCVTPEGTLNTNVQVLLQGKDETIWAATFSNGRLYAYNTKADRFDQFTDDINDLNCLADDDNQTMWAGNYNEIFNINKQTRKITRFVIGKPVRAIHKGKNHTLWIGTEGKGLLEFDSKTRKVLASYSTNEGLSNNAVLNILEDDSGMLWLSTFNGLSKFDPTTKKFIRYEETDGLQSNEFSYGAALKLTNGNLLFGGNNGFNLFDPDSIQLNVHAPALAITNLKIDNKQIAYLSKQVIIGKDHLIEKLRLPYDKSTFSLDFAALEFVSPQKISYKYFLEGLDKNWNDAGSSRSINYNRLHEGSYTLYIKSTDSAGNWADNMIKLEIQILPPWYRTWWAYLFYFSAVVMLCYWYYSYRKKQHALNHEIQLSKFTILKERELSEKRHAFFTNISHEFRTPLTLIINPIKELLKVNRDAEDRSSLQIVHRNAKRLLSLVDQLLVFRKTEDGAEKIKSCHFEIQSFIKEIFLYFSAQAKLQSIAYALQQEPESIYVDADKEKFEIILFNLISNAFKFTPNKGSIQICVTQADRDIVVQIKDTGKGIPDHLGDSIFDKYFSDTKKSPVRQTGFGIGMFLVKTFVEMHGGTITYESEMNVGTIFYLKLPIVAHLQGEDEHTYTPSYLAKDKLPSLLDDPDDSKEDLVLAPTPVEENKSSILLVDDDPALRKYLLTIFKAHYLVYTAKNGIEAFDLIRTKQPDLVVSDIVMEEMDGLSLCKAVKATPHLNHIQFILLTSSTSESNQVAGIQYGADDYILKPFDVNILLLKVKTRLQNKKNLQEFFFNAITLQSNEFKISHTDKLLIERCIRIIEENVLEDFTVTSLADKMGMSHSTLYKKVKAISGKSVNGFIRSVRLKKAAEILILTDVKINEAANLTGFYDQRYFREQFIKLFELTPSAYIKKYRKAFQNEFRVDRP